MKKITTLLLALVMAAPAFGAADPVFGQQVLYIGGTVPGLKEGTLGRLDTTQEEAIVFEAGGSKVAIPYADIRDFRYEEKLARRLGVIATVAVVLVKHRQRRHFIEINYQSKEGTPQVALFEVSKDNAQVIHAVLRTRAQRNTRGATLDRARYPGHSACRAAVAQSPQ